jgi:hypothetical protein
MEMLDDDTIDKLMLDSEDIVVQETTTPEEEQHPEPSKLTKDRIEETCQT